MKGAQRGTYIAIRTAATLTVALALACSERSLPTASRESQVRMPDFDVTAPSANSNYYDDKNGNCKNNDTPLRVDLGNPVDANQNGEICEKTSHKGGR
jgi:hypothetical protein